MIQALLALPSKQILPVFLSKFKFGRDAQSCRYALGHFSASRLHFQVWIQNNELFIQDLGSASGTFVNGVEVSSECPQKLSVGDEISYGNSPQSVEYFSCISLQLNDKLRLVNEKIARISLECERIRAKDEPGNPLSIGQCKTLEKNERDLIQLEKLLVQSLEAMQDASAHSQQQQHLVEEEEDQSESILVSDQDMLDKTTTSNTTTTISSQRGLPAVETYDSLLAKISSLRAQELELEKELGLCNNEDEKHKQLEEEEEDELDKFMASNEQELISGKMSNARAKLKTISEERVRCETLANLAKPPSFLETKKTKETMSKKTDDFRIVHAKVDFKERPRDEIPAAFNQLEVKKPRLLPLHPEVEEEPEMEGSKETVSWQPPANQSGDGKSRMNAKFGY